MYTCMYVYVYVYIYIYVYTHIYIIKHEIMLEKKTYLNFNDMFVLNLLQTNDG